MRETEFEQAYPLATRAAQFRAAAAILSGAVPPADSDDLEQEGLMAVWRALPQFDPSRAALRTFVEHVVANRMASIHRARGCRPRFQPLDRDHRRVGDRWACNIELRSDIERVLATLQDGDRRLARLLAQHTPTEASRLLGIARSSVYERIKHMRMMFAGAGLGPRGVGRGRASRPRAASGEER